MDSVITVGLCLIVFLCSAYELYRAYYYGSVKISFRGHSRIYSREDNPGAFVFGVLLAVVGVAPSSFAIVTSVG